ncbi:efflux RND transporter permease subunit [Planifilum fimeticola]|nr:MMPL family transporter [Planifilum fimeticola]
MADYLPQDTPSMKAVDLMEREFDEPTANARVMIHHVSITEALAYKEKLEAIDGVTEVTWLDDVIDVKEPLEMADPDLVEPYYKNETALISLHIREGDEVETVDRIYELIGEENAVAGEAVDTAVSQKMAGQESFNAALLLIPILIIILVLSTTSWIEPLFFLIAIGVSVLINMGANVFVGEISFVTQSVAPILQLAVSMDYAIFLLHSFSNHRKQISDPGEAMRRAIKESFPAIAASASTTFFGFIALSFMEFGIGADLGLNLVKGIAFSFLSVIVFLPALTLMFYKWIDRTQHPPLVPKWKGFGERVLKLRIPVFIALMLLIVPAFLAQSQTSFVYGLGEQPETSRAGADAAAIREAFGENSTMVLLVPKGDPGKEEKLVQRLEELPRIKSVTSYVNTVSPAIPSEYLEESAAKSFYSDNYARIILNAETDSEGEEAFSLVDEVRRTAESYYDEVHLLGESVTLYDIKKTVERDHAIVNLLTISSIALVLLFTFRSLSIPVVLLLTIQSAVWLNLSVPYFTDSSLVYVGYLIISTVQLAATVDYGILLTDTYRNLRQEMPAMEAIKKTLDDKLFSILTPASILSTVGFILFFTSSNPIVSSIGLLLGRGALLAFGMVVIALPAMLILFDRVIEKTTLRPNFYQGKGGC